MLRPQPISPVPDATARVARAAFRKGNAYMRRYDALGTMFTDEAFAPLFPPGGRPVEAPWRLALVTIMQYAEGLSDRQGADAVRARIDGTYLVALELDDPGFDAAVLSEFRMRLVTGRREHLMLDLMLDHVRSRKVRAAGGRQRTDSTHVLGAIRALNRLECVGAIRALNRLECVGETMRHALNSLAVVAPAWLRALAPAAWVPRYERRVDDDHLPKGQAQRHALAETIGADGQSLLSAVYAPAAPVWLREVPAVQTLRRVWVQQFYREDGTRRTAPGGRHRAVADGGARDPAVRAHDQLALPPGRPLSQDVCQDEHHLVDWLHSPRNRNLRRRQSPSDHAGRYQWRTNGRWGHDARYPRDLEAQRPVAVPAHRRYGLSGRRTVWTPNCWSIAARTLASNCWIAGADAQGLSLAGAGGSGVRRRGLYRGLGASSGDLPTGAHERRMERTQGCARQ